MLVNYEEIKKFHEAVDNLVNIINNQDQKIRELESALHEKENINWNVYGFRVVKKILHYIAQGIEEMRAIALAYDDFNGELSMSSIEAIWRTSRASKSGLILYGRAYCAKKMRLAGFKSYEIAQTLGVSITTVNKLLKECCLSD